VFKEFIKQKERMEGHNSSGKEYSKKCPIYQITGKLKFF
jgi:hypothetical protein